MIERFSSDRYLNDKGGITVQAAAARGTVRDTKEEPRRCYRVERRYSLQRPLRELVRDLLRAHSGA